MIQLIPKIPAYQMFRYFGYPRLFPLNLTVSVSYRCNSRCKTCNVYERKVKEFSLEEFDRAFQSIGSAPYWVTISGGEPFLRNDLPGIVESAVEYLKPSIIHLPTNAIATDRILSHTEKILEMLKDRELNIGKVVGWIFSNEEHGLRIKS